MKSPELYINPKFYTGLFIPDWLLEMGLTLGAVVCYAKLARLAQKKGYAFPKIDRIATLLGVSDRQTRSYLKELKDAELITVNRTGRASNYHLLWHPIMGEPDGSRFPVNVEPDIPSDRKQTSAPFIERTESKKGSKRAAPTNPNIKGFIDWWFNRYQQVVGVKYHVTGKDARMVQGLLKAYPLETVKKIADKLLSSDDTWLLKRGRTIPTLVGEWNKLTAPAAYRPGIDGPSLPDAGDLIAEEEKNKRRHK